MLVDQRMPGLSGLDLLIEARKLYPDAKVVAEPVNAKPEAAATQSARPAAQTADHKG